MPPRSVRPSPCACRDVSAPADRTWDPMVDSNKAGTCLVLPVLFLGLAITSGASAMVRYVDVNGLNPTAPFTNWTTAATTIQDAVEVANSGDEILVTNGIYSAGGFSVDGVVTNRVAVTKPLVVQSVSGPQYTVIQGNQASGIRCVYLTNGCVLTGFTVTNGAADEGGGVWSESTDTMVSNCVVAGSSASLKGGGARLGTLKNCQLFGNSAFWNGGAAYGSTLISCVVAGNSAFLGGGGWSCTFDRCTLSNNVAQLFGGAADSCTLSNCIISGNSVTWASAGGGGGGASRSTLHNCGLDDNSALSRGGGAADSTLINCTLTRNSAGTGGGASLCQLTNCIVYYNAASLGSNYDSGATLNYCCSTPLPSTGTANLQVAPHLTDLLHLSADSPCLGKGLASATSGLDIDGESWGDPPAIGCDEYHGMSVTGAITAAISTLYTNIALGFQAELTTELSGRVSMFSWNFGDGTSISNLFNVSHVWAAPGDYLVVLRAYNETNPGGVLATVVMHVVAQPVHYVALGNSTPSSPYTSWSTAATNIQDAVDVASVAGARVMVSNGVYQTGGRIAYGAQSNRVTVTLPLVLLSANGPDVTLIQGFRSSDATPDQPSVRCVYLTNQAILAGFTLTNGAVTGAGTAQENYGGGVWGESSSAIVSNCIICGNGAFSGGGASGGTLYNCTLANNSASGGGAAFLSTLNSCELTNNQATSGGGVSSCTLKDCILSGNVASQGSGGGADSSTLNSCVLSNNVAIGSTGFQAARWGGYGGGVSGGVLNGCSIIGNLAADGGGAYQATLNNCMLISNVVNPLPNIGWGTPGGNGGGAEASTLNDCSLIGNSANPTYDFGGGGVSQSTLTHCVLLGNSSSFTGGGAVKGSLTNCILAGNTARYGGGAVLATISDSVLTNNSAQFGGGVYGCTMQNCALGGNSAASEGGGADQAHLINCTLTANSALHGGGAVASGLTNCIVFNNTASFDPNYDSSSALSFCCTTPLPAQGTGNLALDPQLADLLHVSANSPCLGRGTFSLVSGLDIDGEPWANPPSIGCDEYYGGSVTGALSVAISASSTNVATGFSVGFQPIFVGRISVFQWDFGDGTLVTNALDTFHRWFAPGDYTVTLLAWNDSNPAGLASSIVIQVVSQPIRYVSLDSSSPSPPYTSWATAATNIQDAVDAAEVNGALVLVSNGVYQSGARVVSGTLSNRVAVTKPLVIQSVNGPAVTLIQGFQPSGGTNGSSAVRCVYLTKQAIFAGFTVTNGATSVSGDGVEDQSGGGVWCESASAVISNCVLAGNIAQVNGGGTYLGTLLNCTLTGNSASSGGGGYGGAFQGCTLAGNSAGASGAGAALSSLTNCTVTDNFTTGYPGSGAGANLSLLVNCLIRRNSAPGPNAAGGGAESCTLLNCIITENSAYSAGGGVHGGLLKNCALSDNTAVSHDSSGGGASGATLNNCTVSGNHAGSSGGGVSSSTLTNCIVYDNQAPSGSNYGSSTPYYCCTSPLPTNGLANLDVDPQLASASHLSAISPCIGRGNSTATSGVDIDGEPWAVPPSIGCDEYYSGSVTGVLNVAIGADYTFMATGTLVAFEALVSGRTTGSSWDFGDGIVLSNRPHATHAWANAGDYPVLLRAYNETYPGGVSATVTVHVASQPVHYVAQGNPTPSPPYNSWQTAATNIADAIKAAEIGATVLVSNGVYQTGGEVIHGSVTNRVAVTKALLLQSANGPSVTVIRGVQVPGSVNGEGAVRCVYLTNGATLAGFTLTGGATRESGDYTTDQAGGGVWCESTSATVINCVILSNTANVFGGGACFGTLSNCTLIGNSAAAPGPPMGSGGGAGLCVLYGCTLNGNYALVGGGAANCTLNDCTLLRNSSPNGGGADGCTLNRCLLNNNSAGYGGGAGASILNWCSLTGNSAINGGGAEGCSLNNCLLTGNSASNPGIAGGGAFSSVLNNCTVSGNSASSGAGGVGNCTLTNSIVYFNSAPNAPNYFGDSFDHCCTSPLPTGGFGNFDADPRFVSNHHLAATSPCINAGLNSVVAAEVDLDGNPRITGGTVDLGAYEFQLPTSLISYAWLYQYGLPVDGSADYADPDGDGRNNWQEWRCGTNPTNSASVLQLLLPSPTLTNVAVTWLSVPGITYFLERSTNLLGPMNFVLLATNLPGQAMTTTYFDTTVTNRSVLFYRVGISP